MTVGRGAQQTEDLESLDETLAILSDPDAMRRLTTARRRGGRRPGGVRGRPRSGDGTGRPLAGGVSARATGPGSSPQRVCGNALIDSVATDDVRDARRARHRAIRAEVSQEEAEAAEADVAQKAAALDVPLHLRIDRELDAELRRQAAEAHVPTSALVRRLLRQAVQVPSEQLTEADVESIARRVVREELHRT